MYKNRAGWAHDRLKRAGLSSAPKTGQALDFAKSVEGVVLIDGARLAELMINHEVGVSAQVVKMPKVDSDYFEEEGS